MFEPQCFYKGKTPLQLAQTHRRLTRRLQLAWKYAQRKAQEQGKAFTFYHPSVYFDPNCSYGFSGTQSWYAKEQIFMQKAKKETASKIQRYQKRNLLERCIHFYLQALKGDIKRSVIDAFQSAKKRLQALGDPQLLQEFLQRIAFPLQLSTSKINTYGS